MAGDFEKVLEFGRPPNVVKLFPHSRALIVSGKVMDRAMLKNGASMTIAANGRNHSVIQGALQAAQRANACIILEIAKSEANYCMTNMWNLARRADQLMNELNITVPVAIHADHYGVKTDYDLERAKLEIPSMFDAGITSIAIDASHRPDDDNLFTNLALGPLVPSWAGYETEVGEIKGEFGLSAPEEALFLIQGLNAHSIFPDWIALNNGSSHGIESSGEGIQVELTREIHEALGPYGLSGAQHGTSGNDSQRLKEIAEHTVTTKANVATALQMISWGVRVNDFGNAELDDAGEFIKESDKGVSDALWAEMRSYADDN
ncbi:MAG: ketose-bisphosphate aldolase, partial [Desulfovibrio sp.]